MTIADKVAEGTPIYLEWRSVIAGAIAAAALSFVLLTFGAAIGLAVSSTAPTWRDTSWMLFALSGLYLVLVALAGFGFGGYLAGRLRSSLQADTPEAVEMRDGAHGLLVWALAVLILALLTAFTASNLLSRSAPTAATPQLTTAEPLLSYELDRLFRAERRPADVNVAADRAEAGRILLTAGSHDGVAAEDRTHLVRLTGARTGLAQPDAERRVDQTVASAKTAISKARKSAVVLAFMTGAALLLGGVAAWFAACAGGRHRDGALPPSMMWEWYGPRRTAIVP